MPLVSLLVDYSIPVYNYKKELETKIFPMECYCIPQPENKILLVVVSPIFYIYEWAIFNPMFRWFMKKGLKKAGYKGSFQKVTRLELVRIIMK